MTCAAASQDQGGRCGKGTDALETHSGGFDGCKEVADDWMKDLIEAWHHIPIDPILMVCYHLRISERLGEQPAN